MIRSEDEEEVKLLDQLDSDYEPEEAKTVEKKETIPDERYRYPAYLSTMTTYQYMLPTLYSIVGVWGVGGREERNGGLFMVAQLSSYYDTWAAHYVGDRDPVFFLPDPDPEFLLPVSG